MTTTVTMSLERYKELESKEKALQEMINKKEVVIFGVPYGHDYMIHATFEEAFIKIKEDIKSVSDLAESWRKQAEKVK